MLRPRRREWSAGKSGAKRGVKVAGQRAKHGVKVAGWRVRCGAQVAGKRAKHGVKVAGVEARFSPTGEEFPGRTVITGEGVCGRRALRRCERENCDRARFGRSPVALRGLLPLLGRVAPGFNHSVIMNEYKRRGKSVGFDRGVPWVGPSGFVDLRRPHRVPLQKTR